MPVLLMIRENPAVNSGVLYFGTPTGHGKFRQRHAGSRLPCAGYAAGGNDFSNTP